MKSTPSRKKAFDFTLSWDRSSSNEAEGRGEKDPAKKFIVERLDGGEDTWLFVCEVPGDKTQVKIPSRLFLKSHSFRVAGVNECGVGPSSEASQNILSFPTGENQVVVVLMASVPHLGIPKL